MSNYVLAIAIGPVQEFIASARRTRDLWFGSYVLSEISKAVAKFLLDEGAELVFPAPIDPEKDLCPGSELNVANKILVLIPSSKDPKILAEGAEKSARRIWLNFAEKTENLAGEAIRKDIWNDQINDVIEFYYAWTTEKKSYKEARERVERILAGRKVLRDFLPSKGRAGIPKSSLDGLRESVLSDPDKMGMEARSRAMLKENEHLDSVGLIKRLSGNPDKFISVSRIAADPWVRGISKTEKGEKLLGEISNLCNTAFSSKIKDDNFREFPWEGEVLFISRLDAMLRDKALLPHYGAIKKIKDLLIKAKLGEPSPYFGILIADGDRMGAILSTIETLEGHRKFSQTLSGFAVKAKNILKKYRGSLVYSGGDDVMAFVPFDKAIDAARDLHDEFAHLLKDFKRDDITPGLSIGLSIGHCHETLEDLLKMGREAEKSAKGEDRDGFAVMITTRSNESIVVRKQWKKKLDERLKKWATLFLENQLPDKLAYDIKELAKDYKQMEETKVWEKVPADLLQKDTERVIKKKKPGEKKGIESKMLKELIETIKTPDDLLILSKELIIARHLSEAIKKEKGPSNILQEVKE